MECLPEEISLIGQENFSSFNLSKIEALGLDFLCGCHYRIAERGNMRSEILRIVDDFLKDFFFIRLEGQVRNFILPRLQILKLRSSSVSRNFDSPVTDRTCIFLVILDFTSRDLQTFTMIPVPLAFVHKERCET